MSDDILKREGLVRTDMHCTNCSKGFIAQFDFSLDGNHVCECPHCGHHHCRVIESGVVTEERWTSRNNMETHEVPGRRVWKSDSAPAMTSSASMFIRDAWLNRGG